MSGRKKSVLTVRAVSGLSGDMMLGGLAFLSGMEEGLGALTAELGLPAMNDCLRLERRSVNGVEGVGCRIAFSGDDGPSHACGCAQPPYERRDHPPHAHGPGEAPDHHGHADGENPGVDAGGAHRSFADIAGIIRGSAMPDAAQKLALKAFSLLAEAEGAVHGVEAARVTFHEVGALDSILDVCLCCRLFALLDPDVFVCSPLPLADGAINCAHGVLPAPAPAVLRLLEGVPVRGFSGSGETVTPTAVSLLKALGARFGPWPEMSVKRTVISYGNKVFPGVANGAVWALGTV
ncbi:MAG: LarC family nickel insertion protein [Desulfovibrio sp.]|nr:LarC family nickel insertion protein [Desulfovibrio sp.]